MSSPSIMPTVTMASLTSVPMVSSGNVRQSTSTINPSVGASSGRATRSEISPHAVHSTITSGHNSVANFQSTFFATPSASAHLSSGPNTPISTINNNSVCNLPMVSHTSAVIATMTTATTTTSSINTMANTQLSVPTVASAPPSHPFSAESLFQPSKSMNLAT